MSKYLLAAALLSASLTCAVSAQAANLSPNGQSQTAEQAAAQKSTSKRLIKDAKQNGIFGVSRWQLNYDWNCTGLSGVWILDVDGNAMTYSDAETGEVEGSWVRDKKAVTFTFYEYPNTAYAGTLSQDNQSAQGTMSNKAGSSGCWTASRL